MRKTVDLRSDTVTRPTAAMRQAMADAVVGDDVYREDPTVNRLEERAAEVVGKQAALFVPSGTMGNQIAIHVHASRGQELICDDRSHIILYEMGGAANLSNCSTRPIRSVNGLLDWASIEIRLRGSSDHYRGTGLIALENTHNMAGGRVYSTEVVYEICAKAHAVGVNVHLDGARIFNAAEHLQQPVSRLAASVDSVMFCLSKGLGAPVGSLLAGDEEFIAEARLVRKAFGGGMRQAGVLAAAGLVALEESPKRLHEDHANAQLLAKGLAATPGISLDPTTVETNILFFDVSATGMNASNFSAALKEEGVLAHALSQKEIRMVTHSDVSREDCEQALKITRAVATTAASAR